MFFERAKRALEARDVYDDFLKLLNMFTRDIIDLKTLVVRAEKILRTTCCSPSSSSWSIGMTGSAM
jgi:histone deacetylase complex regulatory component SIN3